MAKITLRDMQAEVNGRREFEGNSVFSKIGDNFYTVYSYGYHFPMYVYDYAIGKWIGNKDKYSVTTSKQQSKTRPDEVSFWMTTDEMKHMIGKGGFVEYKLREDI